MVSGISRFYGAPSDSTLRMDFTDTASTIRYKGRMTLTPRLSLILALLLAGSSCVEEEVSLEQSEESIINGEACEPSELPQTAALLADINVDFGNGASQQRRLLCTGTLIAPDVVLTAGHCVDSLALTGGVGTLEELRFYISFQSDLTVFTEPNTVAPLPEDALEVRKVLQPDSFDIQGTPPPDGLSNFSDVGLIFLKTPILDIEPAVVMTPKESEILAIGDTVQIAGWGRRTAENSDQIGEKYCATANIFDLGEFEMQVGREVSTSRKCHGDSGGPSFITIDTEHTRKERVIGITSRAYDRELNCSLGGVDTLASAWYQWIDEQLIAECELGERAWCEVEGIIPPSFYDEGKGEELDEGGCSSGSSGSGAIALAILLLAWIRESTKVRLDKRPV